MDWDIDWDIDRILVLEHSLDVYSQLFSQYATQLASPSSH